jgi:hypothetical protein
MVTGRSSARERCSSWKKTWHAVLAALIPLKALDSSPSDTTKQVMDSNQGQVRRRSKRMLAPRLAGSG